MRLTCRALMTQTAITLYTLVMAALMITGGNGRRGPVLCRSHPDAADAKRGPPAVDAVAA
jgi:hypothetical protein